LSVIPTVAALSSSKLDSVTVEPPPQSQVPQGVHVTDSEGRVGNLGGYLGLPTVFVLADYTCTTLCGPIVSFVAAALDQTALRPGRDYRLVVLGLDPKDDAAAAKDMKRTRLGDDPDLAAATTFLTADQASIKNVTDALGYRYVYDAEHDQIAHPAAVFVLTADGHVARVLSALALDGGSLRLALVEAGQGRIGTLRDQVHLLCYGFDPAKGTYNLAVSRLLFASGLATTIALGAFIALLIIQSRRRNENTKGA
jgi:protein SCO1/2